MRRGRKRFSYSQNTSCYYSAFMRFRKGGKKGKRKKGKGKREKGKGKRKG
jgi:hypothetical protein